MRIKKVRSGSATGLASISSIELILRLAELILQFAELILQFPELILKKEKLLEANTSALIQVLAPLSY